MKGELSFRAKPSTRCRLRHFLRSGAVLTVYERSCQDENKKRKRIPFDQIFSCSRAAAAWSSALFSSFALTDDVASRTEWKDKKKRRTSVDNFYSLLFLDGGDADEEEEAGWGWWLKRSGKGRKQRALSRIKWNHHNEWKCTLINKSHVAIINSPPFILPSSSSISPDKAYLMSRNGYK
jgi:hypothetical protein